MGTPQETHQDAAEWRRPWGDMSVWPVTAKHTVRHIKTA